MMLLFAVLLLLAGSMARQTFSREPEDVVVRLGDTVSTYLDLLPLTDTVIWRGHQPIHNDNHAIPT